MTIVEIMKDIVIPLLQAVSVPAAAVVSFAYKAKLDKKIRILEEKNRLLIENSLTLKNGIYYDERNNPFCPACYANTKCVPLQALSSDFTDTHECPACNARYFIHK